MGEVVENNVICIEPQCDFTCETTYITRISAGYVRVLAEKKLNSFSAHFWKKVKSRSEIPSIEKVQSQKFLELQENVNPIYQRKVQIVVAIPACNSQPNLCDSIGNPYKFNRKC